MLLDRQPPGGILLHEINAPAKSLGVQAAAVEGWTDEMMVGFDHGPRNPLPKATNVFHLVRNALSDGMLCYFG